MREFYIKDKKANLAFRGFQPTTDINCPPFDYFRLGYALNSANLFQDLLKVKCPIPIPGHGEKVCVTANGRDDIKNAC